MRAYVLTEDGAGLTEVPDPVPGPGEVVVRTDAAGLCHSDLTLAARPPEAHPFDLPIVLGHELAGTVVEVPTGIPGVRVGDQVVGYGPRGCGACARCSAGAENYCRRPPPGSFAPGLGADGALAEYVAVSAAHLVPNPGLDPSQAAALTDAGLTAFHALGRALRHAGPGGPPAAHGATVVVVGVGGLGHAAVRLAHLAGATVLAIDRATDKLDLARSLGADHALAAGPTALAAVQEITDGRGVDVVLDLVASQETLEHAAAMVAVDGVVSIAGVGPGRLAVGMKALPLGVRTDLPYWGTRAELHELLGLAEAGLLRMNVEEYSLEGAADAYARLESGAVAGRGVVRPRPCQ